MKPRPKPRGLTRHLDGWQAGLIVLVIAGSAILLAVPRAVAPERIPMPHIDHAALRDTDKADARLAVRAQTEELHIDVRALGAAFRHYNEVVASQQVRKFSAARYAVVTAARKALKVGLDSILMLRAYQMVRFLEEVHKWEQTGETNVELKALSGDFVDTIRRNAWCRDGSAEPAPWSATGAHRELTISDQLLRILFKKRWNDIVGIKGPEIELTLDEDRVRFAFLIEHPFRSRADLRMGASSGKREKSRLASVDRLGARDPDYPTLLVKGIVHYRAGSYAQATAAFRTFLTDSPDRPYELRARNYLKAALDRTAETGGM